MEKFIQEIQVRWSDLDPNFHLRHSVYYDWGAYCRIAFLEQFKLPPNLMQQLGIGPVLFREEAVFKREIRFGDKVTINMELVKSRRDYSRWTIQHTIVKNGDTVAAILTVDGAWLDTVKRKLAAPTEEVSYTFSKIALHENFQWED